MANVLRLLPAFFFFLPPFLPAPAMAVSLVTK